MRFPKEDAPPGRQARLQGDIADAQIALRDMTLVPVLALGQHSLPAFLLRAVTILVTGYLGVHERSGFVANWRPPEGMHRISNERQGRLADWRPVLADDVWVDRCHHCRRDSLSPAKATGGMFSAGRVERTHRDVCFGHIRLRSRDILEPRETAGA